MGEKADTVLVCRFDATAADVAAIRELVDGQQVDVAAELEVRPGGQQI
jgi:hypothetical protein